MARLSDKIVMLDATMSEPDFFTRDPERAAKFAKERAYIEKKLVTTEEEWLLLSAELEEG
ncbi:hypothetical protein V6L77_23785 [Pannonibacter sp. Pt2-lr]